MKFMGIDVGTTGVKAAVFDEYGTILGYGFKNYDILIGENKTAEQDAPFVWSCTKQVMAAAAAQAGPDISAISLSSQGDAVIPVDSDGNALHNCILGMDYRTENEAELCSRLLGDKELYQKTGMRSHPLNSITKMMWFHTHCGDFEGKLWKYTTYADYILLKLGADAPVIDYTMASRVMAMNMEDKQWDKDILAKTGIDEDYLSSPVPSGTVVGTLKKEVAEETGIQSDARIVTGGHDQPCAALGAGVTGEGIALDSHGTAEVLSTAFGDNRTKDALYEGFYPCTCHVVEDTLFSFALNHTGGLLLQWFRDNICEKDKEDAVKAGMEPYSYLIGRTPDGPSSVLVLPHFNGSGTPWCDLGSKGAVVGLTMDATRYDIIKGVLDSLTYEMRINIEYLRRAGIPIRRLRCVGGAAKSEKWMQLKADIMGCTVERLEVREAACLGAAMLAASAVGAYRSPLEALVMVQLKDRFEPSREKSRLYDEKFCLYEEIYGLLKSLNHRL